MKVYMVHVRHIELAKLMIEHGTNNWNSGLSSACIGDHIELAKLMIEHGANDFNGGLHDACTSHRIN